MEENENVEMNDTVVNEVSENGGGLKSKKGLIIAIVVALVVIFVIFNVFFNTKGKAKAAVKDYIKALNKPSAKKMLKVVEPYGSYVFAKLDKDEYEDFWDEYKEFLKSDDYDDYKEEYEERLEDIDELQEMLDDEMEDAKVKVKSFKEVKKVGKNLYRVKAKVETKEDDDKKTTTMTFYVMKKGLKCYIVDGGML